MRLIKPDASKYVKYYRLLRAISVEMADNLMPWSRLGPYR